MVIAIDPNVLLSWAQQKAGITTAGGGSGPSGGPSKIPTPPWSAPSSSASSSSSSSSSSASSPPPLSATAKLTLEGAKFFDPSAAKLDVQGANAGTNQDYRDLFAVYQGLDSLNQLAQQMSNTGLSSFDKSQLQQRFSDGMKELQAFLGSTQFNGFQMVQGKTQTSEQTTAGVPLETDTYTTGTLYAGAMNGEVPAFQGNVQFSLTVTKLSGDQVNVDFDLSEMGSTPRTMGNVVNYLNSKMQAAGLATTFSDVFTPGAPRTVQAGGKTVSLGNGPDQYALKITGFSTEALAFSAPVTSPAVYVAQTSGNTGGTKPDATQQLFKLQTDPASGDAVVQDRISSDTFGPQVQAVRATAAAPDGSLYVLGDVNGTTSDGQTIQGQQDVALMKYDSAGNLLYTRTLGAAGSASGYALAVSADGSKVAVAGTVSGVLQGTSTPSDPTQSNTFVTEFNALGEEQWTSRGGAAQGDQPSAVAFGADGSVYVSGKTLSALPGQSSKGGADGYLEGFSATGVQKFATEFGTSGQDSTGGLAVSGSSVYVAGVESGHAVVRQYDLQPSGAPVLAAQRDLGDLQGGDIAGVAVDGSGAIIVGGSTHSTLAAGQVGAAFQPGKDAFVATLQPGLAASPSDAISYFQGGADTTATKMVLSGGQAYLTGQLTGAPSVVSGGLPTQTGFAVQIDPATGAVGWSSLLPGADNLASPNAIAVDPTGASALDQMGLPRGTISYVPSQLITATTSLRAGDQFQILTGSGGGIGATVTIAADDTFATLATKIQRASDFQLTATVLPTKGVDQLKLAPVNPRTRVQLVAGPAGKDALGPLGLSEGVITNPPTSDSSSSSSSSQQTKPTFSLQLASGLGLDNATDAKAASAALASAIGTVKSAYTLLTAPPASKNPGKTGGTVPTYLSSEIANYQAALNRLTAGQSSSDSSSGGSGILTLFQ
jgi:hypothetical protein